MPQAPTPAWAIALRLRLRTAVPTGLTVKGQASNGKVVLSWRPPGAKSAKSLTLPGLNWTAAESSAIQRAVMEVVAELEAGRPFGLPQALAINRVTGGPMWEPVTTSFKNHKLRDGHVSERTWRRMYAPEMKLLLLHGPLMATPAGLIRRLIEGLEPGTRGRQQRVQHLCQTFRWGISEGLLPGTWAPPTDLRDLIGKRLKPKAPAHPIKDPEVLELVEQIKDARWRLAIQLLGTFGLRPVELLHLRPLADGRLECDYTKRTSRGSTKARTISALLPAGVKTDWLVLPKLISAGAELPPLADSKGAAESLNQFLSRDPTWQALKAAAAKEGRRLTPYSFRHGFALRAHQFYGLSPRISASLMGHSLTTHTQHYGAWADTETIQKAVTAAYLNISTTIS